MQHLSSLNVSMGDGEGIGIINIPEVTHYKYKGGM
jgi:hypothetical protein